MPDRNKTTGLEAPEADPAPATLRQVRQGAGWDDNPLSVKAYETIFSAIQSGTLRPGSRIREAELTLSLGMSRTPLREALQRLQSEGLIILEAQRGIRIVKLTRQELTELFTAREWAEGAAASLAANYASQAEIEMLRHILALEEAVADNPAAGARYNRKLHATIHESSRNRYLIGHLQALNALLALAGESTRRSAGRYQEALNEHRALIEAIESRNPDLAERRAREHIRASQRFVLAREIDETLHGE
jgi:DNA-binding GntR family transcriptional regulator